ncbi:DUF2911 domain-containing protein [Bizionia argentinensis JUB59]|uniref:DUF2911 domain-containing protein n=1 Tax=Bizionia argentinensis JUB59 TaxID=1046627 RepID=G2EAB6_9FLAO|nr:DUF2911 domain-containing protein [Bizionia argentinensis]EGV44606.1 DUF2911 domain-containing protein [Bizionia argentinensis JUB59]
MKKSPFTKSIAFAFVLLFTTALSAQEFSGLDKSPMDAATFPSDYKESNKTIKVLYSRPQLNNRLLSQLAPNDKVWRTGANEAVQITFYKDTNFGGKMIDAGTYSLATIPGDKEWTIIINKDLNTWGSYFYKEENDVARVIVPVKMAEDSVEAFSIIFDEDATMHMGWDKVRLAVPTSSK